MLNRRLLSIITLSALAVSGFAKIENVPQEISPVNPPFEMPQPSRPVIPDRTFDIRDFGAKTVSQAEGHKNTNEIAATIDAASRAGGGTVLIPEGTWLTGPIHLESNIDLHVAKGALVLFSEDREDYLPIVRQRHEGVEAYNYSPMIYAFELENVSITGQGTLNARGDHWWEWYEELGAPPRAIASKVPLSRRDFGKGSGMEGMRPNFVVFWKSKNILVEDITLVDTPMWNIHLIYSEQAIVRGVTIDSVRAPNGDGCVIDSSKNVLVEYNHFQTGDDAVVLKSGLNEEGLKINIPTENVVVRNFEAKNVKTGSGGVVFGSETSGGIKNVYVHNAYFEATDRGIRFKTERGRGNAIEDIYIENIRMKDVTYEAINFNTFYTGPGKVGPSPAMRNIIIKDVKIDGVPEAIVLIGLPEKWLENIHLENIEITKTKEGARITRVKNLTLKNVSIISDKRAMIVEDVYEMTLDEVNLVDKAKGKPLLLTGKHTGAIFTDNFDVSEIDFEDGLSSDIVSEKPSVQGW